MERVPLMWDRGVRVVRMDTSMGRIYTLMHNNAIVMDEWGYPPTRLESCEDYLYWKGE